jgi:hypothetical protein
MTATTLPSSDNAAAMDDRRILELLIMVVVIHSLLRKEGANDDDDDAQLEQMKETVRQSCSVAINRRGDQFGVSKELLVITQCLLDNAQLRLLDNGGEENEGRVVASSSASDHQLMETTAAAKKEDKAAAAKKKKKRNKKNKAAAKHKGTKLRSCLGGGIISLLMMAASFSSVTTFITLSYGSSEGNKAPPTLPPSTSTSLRQRDLQSSNNIAPASPASVSPFSAVVQSPIFSPAAVSNRPMNSVDESALLTCFDTPNWKIDLNVNGMKIMMNLDVLMKVVYLTEAWVWQTITAATAEEGVILFLLPPLKNHQALQRS